MEIDEIEISVAAGGATEGPAEANIEIYFGNESVEFDAPNLEDAARKLVAYVEEVGLTWNPSLASVKKIIVALANSET